MARKSSKITKTPKSSKASEISEDVKSASKSKKKTQGLKLSAFINKLAKTVGDDGISIKSETQSIIQQLLVGLLEIYTTNFNIVLNNPGRKKTIKIYQARALVEVTLGREASDLTSEVLETIDTALEAKNETGSHDLIFAVPRTARYFKSHLSGYCDTSSKGPKKFKVTTRRLGKGMGICVTAMLQSICFRILSKASETLKDGKRSRLVPRQLFLTIQNDPELAYVFRRFISQGGVLETFESKKTLEAETSATKTTKKSKTTKTTKKTKKETSKPKSKKTTPKAKKSKNSPKKAKASPKKAKSKAKAKSRGKK